MNKFKEARITKGLKPDTILYQGQDIRLLMNIGDTVAH